QERTELEDELRLDLSERDEILKEAVILFNSISSALYEKSSSGWLTVSATDNGPDFELNISGAKSAGINNMQIYCFDMMLMRLSVKNGLGPRFLIHDSHLFDGVDDRQVKRALELG